MKTAQITSKYEGAHVISQEIHQRYNNGADESRSERATARILSGAWVRVRRVLAPKQTRIRCREKL